MSAFSTIEKKVISKKINQIFVYMEYPEGTSINKTNATAKLIEVEIKEVISQEKYMEGGTNFMIDSNVSVVGAGARNPETDKGGDQDMPWNSSTTRHNMEQETMLCAPQAVGTSQYAMIACFKNKIEKEDLGNWVVILDSRYNSREW